MRNLLVLNAIRQIAATTEGTGGTSELPPNPVLKEDLGAEPNVSATQDADEDESVVSDPPIQGKRYRNDMGDKLTCTDVKQDTVSIKYDDDAKESEGSYDLSREEWASIGAEELVTRAKGTKDKAEGTMISPKFQAVIDTEVDAIWEDYSGIYELELQVERRKDSLSDRILHIAQGAQVEADERGATSYKLTLNLFNAAVKRAEARIQEKCHTDEDLDMAKRFFDGTWKVYISRLRVCVEAGVNPLSHNKIGQMVTALEAMKEAARTGTRDDDKGKEGGEAPTAPEADPTTTLQETIAAAAATIAPRDAKAQQALDTFLREVNEKLAKGDKELTTLVINILNTATVNVRNAEKRIADGNHKRNGNGSKASENRQQA